MRRLAIAMATAIVVATPCFAADAKLDDASRVVDAFHAALENGDRDAALGALDDDVQIYEQGWVETSKAEYAKEHLGADLEFAQSTKSEQSSRSGALIGDLAYVMTEGRTSGEFEGKPINSITLETAILRHTKDDWRIVHIHWSSRKPNPKRA